MQLIGHVLNVSDLFQRFVSNICCAEMEQKQLFHTSFGSILFSLYFSSIDISPVLVRFYRSHANL